MASSLDVTAGEADTAYRNVLDLDTPFHSSSTAPEPTSDDKPKTLIYLAYGSNLSASVFQGRRGIKPLSQTVVVVPELTLAFDLPGIPYVEPCFANVHYRSKPGTEVVTETNALLGDASDPHNRNKNRWQKGLVGVAYEVTEQDFARIVATEGGGASYQNIIVDCYPLAPGDSVPEVPKARPFKAHTLHVPPGSNSRGRAKRPDPNYAQASPRYLKLLTSGAQEHDFPQEYRTFLSAIQPYIITQTRQKIGRWVFFAIWAPVIISLFALERLFADKQGRSPPWLVRYGGAIFVGVWTSYDLFFRRLFGDGERTSRKSEEENGQIKGIESGYGTGGGIKDQVTN
ncbi:MAG: hypothetical protein M1829_005384 [Trizodia sp. TS-e1964]|nr:MAG: hypothetical protein M1829_005384 [Trizodia sp. TS-e1964]